jgi:hypothetical protein
MVEFLGYLSQFLFIGATFFQARKVHQDGHADGLSHALIWMLSFGFVVMVYYTITVLDSDPVMLTGYIGQMFGFLYMAKMKYFPRNHVKKQKA